MAAAGQGFGLARAAPGIIFIFFTHYCFVKDWHNCESRISERASFCLVLLTFYSTDEEDDRLPSDPEK